MITVLHFVTVVVAGPNTLLHELTCVVSIGYFIFDFFWCLYHQSEGKFYHIHEHFTHKLLK